MVKLTKQDLIFILKQIKIAEAHAAGGDLKTLVEEAAQAAGATGTAAPQAHLLPYGLRTVDGSYNNLFDGRETWGSSGQPFKHLAPINWVTENDDTIAFGGPTPLGPDGDYSQQGPSTSGTLSGGSLIDADPRIISNLIVDQTSNNPAAILVYEAMLAEGKTATREQHVINGVPQVHASDVIGADGTVLAAAGSPVYIYTFENFAPDIGDSAPYNSMFTLFGQFFDHGLDLVAKGGNGTVYIPLQPDDPLYVPGSPTNFMTMTRSSIDANGEVAANVTTPWVDQNQTYTSHPSHQVFLREYVMDENGEPVATGHLLEGARGLSTWGDVKAQARDMLGIELTDLDVGMVPMLLTDPYGAFVRGPNGLPMILAGFMQNGTPIYVEGDLNDPVNPSAIQLTAGMQFWDGVGNPALAADNMETLSASAVIMVGSTATVLGAGVTVNAARAPNAFLDDIAHAAAPVTSGGVLQADNDDAIGYSGGFNTRGQQTSYDDELLDAHYITGDGRGNENIGLSAIHHVFHSEHNNVVEDTKQVVLESADVAFINEWLDADHQISSLADIDTQAEIDALVWNGERLFQTGRFTTEMQYQHLVFEEFARKMQPDIDAFVFEPSSDVDPVIFAEFAHAVYRFGHSMLNQDIDRLVDNGDNTYSFDNITLFDGFLNPLEFGAVDGNGNVIVDHDTAAGAIIRGMSRQGGNEIDEFVTDVLRNQLVGIPLDLAALNIARGRDVGLPTLNQARAQFYEMAGQDTQLKPYVSWADFGLNLQNPVSIVNFIAAYGRHSTIEAETTLDGKRAAAAAIVLGGAGAPADRLDFLNSTGDWANQETGLNEIDLWIGGLAEKKMDFGGMLGSTFAFVFELQLENLQDADRFYYLSRVQGLNLLNELENNSLSKIIIRNTDFGEDSTALPGDIFSTPDFTLEMDIRKQQDYTPVSAAELAAATVARDAAQTAYNEAATTAGETDAADLLVAATAAQNTANGSDASLMLASLIAIASAAPVNTDALATALALYIQAVNDDSAAAAAQAALAEAIADDEAAAAALAALNAAQAALAALQADNGKDPTHGDALLEALGPLVERRDANNDGIAEYLKFNGGDHVVIGGTSGADTIIAGEGDDSIWGYGGNDTLEAGYGVDHVHGGEGNDVITNAGTDIGAMDFLHGEGGNDVIQGGSGLALIFGNEGNDFIVAGPDGKHLLGGLGTDFVMGGDGVDFVMGNEGDDWLEGGGRFDTLAGENSELFFNSPIVGHDVMMGGSNDTDYDAESGDDIMFQSEGIQRNNGMAGFDWVINKNDPHAGNIDLGIPIFATQEAFILRDRMDLVEGASGWVFDDVIVGRAQVVGARAELQNTAAIPGADSTLDSFSNALLEKNVDLIDGLRDLVAFKERVVARDANGVAYTYVDANGVVREEQIVVDTADASDILLGGGGDDLITGLAGDDIIDGDKWLNVRIRLNDVNGNEIGTVESMTSQVFDLAGNVMFGGRTLDALMFDRTLNPGQLEIVREILDGDANNSDIDTASFIDTVDRYTITANDDGSITVSHTGFDAANFPPTPEGARNPVSDGADRLYNIERLRFSDGNGGFVTYTIEEITPVPASGAAIISDLTPIEGTALTVDASTITDPNGVGPLQYQWQRSVNGGPFTDIAGATNASYTPQDVGGSAFGADAGAQLRVVVSFVDILGTLETITSAPTGPVGVNVDAPALPAVTINGLAGDDMIAGSLLADTLRGAAGVDTLIGRTGNDILVGGAGNDDLRGGQGNDRAEYAGVLTNFRYTYNPATSTLSVIDTTGAEGTDTTTDVEMFRFNGSGIQNYVLVAGTDGDNANLNRQGTTGSQGAANSQLVIGANGNDTLLGGTGNDILVGGNGNDTLFGQEDDDFFIQYAGDTGFDVIAGGGGTDTYVLHGTAGADAIRIYTAAEAQAAGIAISNPNSTIIITLNGTTTANKIAELRMVEEIIINTTSPTVNDGNGVVNGGAAGGGDTITVIGNFVGSGLDYSTITIEGSTANDTVDISGLTSAHRVVFDSNGGTDTLIGNIREQDVFNGSNLNDQRVAATVAAATAATVAAATAATTAAFGSADGLESLVGLRAQLKDLGFLGARAEGLGHSIRTELGRLTVDSEFELTQFALETNLNALDHAMGRTMIDTGFDQMPLDLVEHVAPVRQVSLFNDSFGDRRMLASDVDFLAY